MAHPKQLPVSLVQYGVFQLPPCFSATVRAPMCSSLSEPSFRSMNVSLVIEVSLGL